MKPIILVKIGGSLITDKTKEKSIREKALDTICEEIKKASKLNKTLIIGHGAGSFAHFPAQKYQTHKGILNKDSYKGICEVADVACQLNRIVVRKLLNIDVNAISISPFSFITAKNHNLNSIHTDSLELALKNNLLPIVYGDQILDTKIGCTIFSTEQVLGFLGIHLKNKGYEIEQIIHCGETNGVYDEFGKTITLINSSNFDSYQKVLTGSSGVDVTGGMIHKVEETLLLAKQGIPGLIIDGIEHGSLSKAVKGEKVVGTKIEK